MVWGEQEHSKKQITMIRRYAPKDLDDLLTAWEKASEIAHPFLSEEFIASERENIPNLYLPNAETWVFDADGRVVGFIALIGIEVGAILVHPSHQKLGIGQQLMDKAKKLRGDLEVEVFAANSIGRAFYSKYGFVLIHEKVHESTGQDVLRLKLA